MDCTRGDFLVVFVYVFVGLFDDLFDPVDLVFDVFHRGDESELVADDEEFSVPQVPARLPLSFKDVLPHVVWAAIQGKVDDVSVLEVAVSADRDRVHVDRICKLDLLN